MPNLRCFCAMRHGVATRMFYAVLQDAFITAPCEGRASLLLVYSFQSALNGFGTVLDGCCEKLALPLMWCFVLGDTWHGFWTRISGWYYSNVGTSWGVAAFVRSVVEEHLW